LDQIAHQHQGLVHLPEVTNAFPTHGFVNMKQCPVPTVESRVVGDLPTKALPCTLKIGQDGLLNASWFDIKSYELGPQSSVAVGVEGWSAASLIPVS
jgi:hypothetical protein